MSHTNHQSRAILVDSAASSARLTEFAALSGDLAPGELELDVTYSSLNYKDAMALRGDPGVVRTAPLIPGIDAVGTVHSSADERFLPGQQVVVCGSGLGESRDGGYAPQVRVPAAAAVVLPDGLTAWQAAALGTAGFTAALCVLALVDHEVAGAVDAPVLVTGATGGVGSLALHLLHSLGHEAWALTGRPTEYGDYLRDLGAADVMDRDEFSGAGKPLQKARFSAVVDTVGSHTLVNALAQLRWGGVAAACGMAQGPDLPGSVLPFILRGITLVGANSVDAPTALRERAWGLLAEHVDPGVLAQMTEEVGLAEVIAAGENLLAGKRHGRTVVRIDELSATNQRAEV